MDLKFGGEKYAEAQPAGEAGGVGVAEVMRCRLHKDDMKFDEVPLINFKEPVGYTLLSIVTFPANNS